MKRIDVDCHGEKLGCTAASCALHEKLLDAPDCKIRMFIDLRWIINRDRPFQVAFPNKRGGWKYRRFSNIETACDYVISKTQDQSLILRVSAIKVNKRSQLFLDMLEKIRKVKEEESEE